jgi:hypothetical protein
MTTMNTAKDSTQVDRISIDFLSLMILLAAIFRGIYFLSIKAIAYYSQTQVCDRYATAKTDDAASLVSRYRACIAEFKR